MSSPNPLAALYARFVALTSGVRFGQFVSVGVLGAVCENVVLIGLVQGGGVGPALGKLVGAEVSIVVMFAANERWTFAGEGTPGIASLARRFLTSNLVRAAGLVVGIVVFEALLRWVDVSLFLFGIDVWLLVANAISIGVGLVVNYVTESLFTWRVHAGAEGE